MNIGAETHETNFHFIVGPHRSGTTYLQTLVASMPDVGTAPETHFFCRVLPYLRELEAAKQKPIQFSDIKNALTNIMLQGEDIIDFWDKLELAFLEDGYLGLFTCLMKQFTNKNAKLARVYIEKTPGHLWNVEEILEYFPSAKFIILMRDPRAIAVSLLKLSSPKSREMRTKHLVSEIKYLETAFKKISEYEKNLPDKAKVVKYEDLVMATDQILKDICQFLEVTFQTNYDTGFTEVASRIVLSSETHKRQNFQPLSDIDLRPWLNLLSYEETLFLEMLVQDELLTKYGYYPKFYSSIAPIEQLIDITQSKANEILQLNISKTQSVELLDKYTPKVPETDKKPNISTYNAEIDNNQNQRVLKIAFCVNFPANIGFNDYHYAWMMAEALANLGHQVTCWVNKAPSFTDNVADGPKHGTLNIQCDSEFSNPPQSKFDIVILVPSDEELAKGLPVKSILLAIKNRAKFVLINTTAPNGLKYQSLNSPESGFSDSWLKTGKFAHLILSFTQQSDQLIKNFLGSSYESGLFRLCYPPNNSIMVDSVESDSFMPPSMPDAGLVRFEDFTNRLEGIIQELMSVPYSPISPNRLMDTIIWDSYWQLCGELRLLSEGQLATEKQRVELKRLNEELKIKNDELVILQKQHQKDLAVLQKHNQNLDRETTILREKQQKSHNIIQGQREELMKLKEDPILKPIIKTRNIAISGLKKMMHQNTVERIRNIYRNLLPKASTSSVNLVDSTSSVTSEVKPIKSYSLNTDSPNDNQRLMALKGIHAEKRAFLLGNGPSVRPEDLESLDDEIAFAANRFYLAYEQFNLKMRPTYTVCVDLLVLKNHGPEIAPKCETPFLVSGRKADFTELEKFRTDNVIALPELDPPLNTEDPDDFLFSTDPTKAFGQGYGVIYAMMQLAVWMGIKEMYLYGIDH
ncbi:MAG: sulfotransferase, partial [Flavobacteriaceae bacterium]|nr:sulfotransferase [Flavobacteriaceae bacterium]